MNLDEWLDAWEATVEAGQSSIPRAEAVRRFAKVAEHCTSCGRLAELTDERCNQCRQGAKQ